MGQGLDGNREGSRKSEVTDLDVTLVGHKEVLRLEVSVDDPFGVAVVNTFQKLVEHLLDTLLSHGAFVLPHILLQVVLDKFKNQIEFLLVGLEHDLFEAIVK